MECIYLNCVLYSVLPVLSVYFTFAAGLLVMMELLMVMLMVAVCVCDVSEHKSQELAR